MIFKKKKNPNAKHMKLIKKSVETLMILLFRKPSETKRAERWTLAELAEMETSKQSKANIYLVRAEKMLRC